MSIILSLAGYGVSDDCPSWDGYRKVIRISGKAAIKLFGTRTGVQKKRRTFIERPVL
jgi:hypothetical protein